jgi:hypothetical protein
MNDWQPITSGPFNRDIQVSVIEKGGDVHVLVSPCRQTPSGWLRAFPRQLLFIEPTHWREWPID